MRSVKSDLGAIRMHGSLAIAKVLLTWELGSGLGHVARLSPIVKGLTTHGHEAVVALCQPRLASTWFAGIRCLPAPPIHAVPVAERRAVDSFADILANAGWDQSAILDQQVKAWRELIDGIRPDLVVMDHSPTVHLASQGCRVKRVLMGTGFVIPPNESPLPSLNPMASAKHEGAAAEPAVLVAVNASLASMKAPPLPRLGALFTRAEAVMLTTLAELDHYGPREGATYWGAWPGEAQATPSWPKGRGPKVFAYLKPFPELKSLLYMLQQSGLPTLVYLAGIDATQAKSASQRNLRIVSEPVDLRQAARVCELAILHAGLGATTDMLLAGVPMLLIPLQQEQLLLSARVTKLGAAQIASSDSSDQISRGLQRLLTDPRFGRAAKSFATQYADYDPDAQVKGVVGHIEAFL